ncbi:MAG: hypothetical protein RLZZ419_1014 [Pseudomonadota bacterium]|jgi:hypothetical protein
MSEIPYDPKRCSLFRPANLDELPPNEQINKGFFSDPITQAIRQQRSHETNPTDAGLCTELSRLAYLMLGFEVLPITHQSTMYLAF